MSNLKLNSIVKVAFSSFEQNYPATLGLGIWGTIIGGAIGGTGGLINSVIDSDKNKLKAILKGALTGGVAGGTLGGGVGLMIDKEKKIYKTLDKGFNKLEKNKIFRKIINI